MKGRLAPIEKRVIGAALLAFLCSAAGTGGLWAQAPPAGQIKGAVLAEGKPIAGAAVVFGREPSKPPLSKPVSGFVRSLADGSFAISNLLDGAYRLCAQAAGMLNPCLWSDAQTVVPVTGGNTVTGIQITLAKGAMLPVRVEDPAQLLEAKEKDATPRIFAILARSRSGLLVSGRLASKDAKGRDYELLVPFDTLVILRAHHEGADIQDEVGKSVTKAPVEIPGLVPSAGPPVKPIVLRVAGPR